MKNEAALALRAPCVVNRMVEWRSKFLFLAAGFLASPVRCCAESPLVFRDSFDVRIRTCSTEGVILSSYHHTDNSGSSLEVSGKFPDFACFVR